MTHDTVRCLGLCGRCGARALVLGDVNRVGHRGVLRLGFQRGDQGLSQRAGGIVAGKVQKLRMLHGIRRAALDVTGPLERHLHVGAVTFPPGYRELHAFKVEVIPWVRQRLD